MVLYGFRILLEVKKLQKLPERTASDAVFRGVRTGTIPLEAAAFFAVRQIPRYRDDDRAFGRWTNVVAHISGHEEADEAFIRVSTLSTTHSASRFCLKPFCLNYSFFPILRVSRTWA